MKRALSASSQNQDPFDDHHDQSYYHRAEHHPSTQSIEISNEHEVPLTRLWSYILLTRRRNRISNDGHGKRRQLRRGDTYPGKKRQEDGVSNKRERNTASTLKSRVRRVTNRFRSRYRTHTTQSMPEEMMNTQSYHNIHDSGSEEHEHVELNQVSDSVKGESFVDIESVEV